MDISQLRDELVRFSNGRSDVNTFVDYDDYIKWQTLTGMSHESDNEHWKNGQVRCIKEIFTNINRNSNILIASCGDGCCIKTLKELGFTKITGLEICDSKIEKATTIWPNIIKTDICSGPLRFENNYDILYSSHTLEHVLNPIFSLKELSSHLVKNGLIYLILPYPDFHAGNPQFNHNFKVHCGAIPLGLNIADNGVTTKKILTDAGFNVLNCSFQSYREPEIHLTLSVQ
jgi:SAM-dependent methyltransferase